MAEEIPDFIDREFIEKVWKKNLKDENLLITECSISLVGDKGDNYSSTMCRAVCTIKTNDDVLNKSMVIKTLPTGTASLKYVTQIKAFEKEIKMLEVCIPAMEKILSSVGENISLGAKLYYAEIEPHMILAMEDLSVEEFSVSNRFKGLDIDECLTVAKSLAAFHAASLILINEKPELKEIFRYTIWGPNNRENLDPGVKGAYETVLTNVDSWSAEKWSEKMKMMKLPEGLYEITGSTINPKYPVVLNHGDLWINNIMFKRSGSSLDLRFVDLQLPWVNSLAFDILYFIFTSPRPDIRLNHMETIMETYHTRFLELSELLGLSLSYSFDDMKQDCRNHLFFGYFTSLFVFPIVSAPKEDALDTTGENMDGVMADSNIFNNKYFQQGFLASLKYFDKEGLFESNNNN